MNTHAPNASPKTNSHLFFLQGEAPGAPGLRCAHCNKCGASTLGRVPVCSICFSPDIEVTAAGQKGELIEFSIARHPAGGFEAPYAIGQIRTQEGMVLFAPLIGDADSLSNGNRLHFVLVDHAGATGFGYARSDNGEPEA